MGSCVISMSEGAREGMESKQCARLSLHPFCAGRCQPGGQFLPNFSSASKHWSSSMTFQLLRKLSKCRLLSMLGLLAQGLMPLKGLEPATSKRVQNDVTHAAADNSASEFAQAAQAAHCSAVDSILLSHGIIKGHITSSWLECVNVAVTPAQQCLRSWTPQPCWQNLQYAVGCCCRSHSVFSCPKRGLCPEAAYPSHSMLRLVSPLCTS